MEIVSHHTPYAEVWFEKSNLTGLRLACEATTYSVLSKGSVAPLTLAPPNLSSNLPDAAEYEA